MAEVRLRACDICGKHEGMPKVKIERVVIEIDGERCRAELCQDDLRPIRETMDRVPSDMKRSRQRRDFERLMVDSLDEVPRNTT